MKKILSLGLVVLSTTVMANPFGPITGTTASPLVSTTLVKACAENGGDDGQAIACLALLTVAPLSTASILLLVALKEDIQQVEQDAYNYLAGEEISEALKALIDSAKAENEELAQRSDKEIAAAMLQTLNIQ